jgi:hypothetical protein
VSIEQGPIGERFGLPADEKAAAWRFRPIFALRRDPKRTRNATVTVLTTAARRTLLGSSSAVSEKGDIDFAFFLSYQRC